MKKKPAEVVLFDADKTQNVILTVPYKSQTVRVEHRLNFPTDERLTEFYRDRKVEEKLTKDGFEADDSISTACENLWEEMAQSVAGYAKSDRPDWKKVTPLAHKEGAIDKGLMMATVVAPEVLDSELLFDPDDDVEEVKLEILFDAQYVYPSVFFHRPNAVQLRAYRKIRDSNLKREKDRLIETTCVNIVDRAKLFDELLIEAKGWKGRVPITHKAVAIMGLFEAQIQLVTKN